MGTLLDLSNATAAGFEAVGGEMRARAKYGEGVGLYLANYGGGSTKSAAVNDEAIEAAITAAAAVGGDEIDIGYGTLKISASIDLTAKHGVRLVSRGKGQGSYGLLKATLAWYGAAGATMLKVDAVDTPTVGIGWAGVQFDGRGVAGYCARLACVGTPVVSDYRMYGATIAQFLVTGDPAVGYDNQLGTFDRGQIIATGAADALVFAGIAAAGPNTNNFAFRNTYILHEQGKGIDYAGGDSNTFADTVVSSSAVASSGIGLHLRAGSGALAGRGAVFNLIQVNGGEMGRTNFIVEEDHATAANRPSSNLFLPLLTMNGGGTITRCTASTLFVIDDSEIMGYLRQIVFRDETASPFGQLYRAGSAAYAGGDGGHVDWGWNTNGPFKGSDVADLLLGVKTDFGAFDATFVPVVTAVSGSLTSAAATANYRQIGKLVFWAVRIAITTNGTAAGALQITQPVNKRNTTTAYGAMSGHEETTGKGLVGYSVNTTTTRITFADGLYPGANGAVLHLNGWYEAA